MSVKARLILVLSLIQVASFLITGVVNYQVSRAHVRKEIITSSLPLTRDTIYSEITTSLVQPLYVASAMANDAFLRSWAEQGEENQAIIQRYLSEIRTKYGFLSSFFVSARTANYYHSDGILKRVSPEDEHDVWFYSFIDSQLEYDLDVDTNQASGNVLTVFINFRVLDASGELLGVTGVGLEMDRIAELLRGTQDRFQRIVYLTDPSGLVQAHADITRIERVNIRDVPGLGDIAADVLSHRESPVDLSYEGTHGPTLLTARYLPDLDWFLIVEQYENVALESARRNLFRTLLIGFVASTIIIVVAAVTVNHFQNRLERLTLTDELTGACNRRAFDEQFGKVLSRFNRHKVPFSLILLDIDRFKQVNDTRGHLEGDRVLKALAGIVRLQIRPTDLLSRWGGDEFAVLMECGAEDAHVVANRIRLSASEELSDRTVTVSAGIAEYCEGESPDDLIRRADQALYAAKNTGRDRVVAAERS